MPKLKTYLFSYQYEGRQFGFDVPAHSLDEARRRVKAMTWATYDGEMVARIPAYAPGAGLLTRAIVGVRNFFAGGNNA